MCPFDNRTRYTPPPESVENQSIAETTKTTTIWLESRGLTRDSAVINYMVLKGMTVTMTMLYEQDINFYPLILKSRVARKASRCRRYPGPFYGLSTCWV